MVCGISEMIGQNGDCSKLMVDHWGNTYDYAENGGVMGSGIACCGENEWTQKPTKLGRFIL